MCQFDSFIKITYIFTYQFDSLITLIKDNHNEKDTNNPHRSNHPHIMRGHQKDRSQHE